MSRNKSKSPKFFSEVVKELSYKGKESSPLSNITFFLGAGFSKSWDNKFPISNELFQIDNNYWTKKTKFLFGFLTTHGLDGSLDLTPELLKQLVYQLGMYKKYPEIRPRYIDEGNISLIEAELRKLVISKFAEIAPLYYFDENIGKVKINHPLNDEQKSIITFFSNIQEQSTGSEGLAEGIRLNFLTTNYDLIIEAILDYTLSEGDSSFLYTYRGLTPNKICGVEDLNLVHDNYLCNNLLKINGGFEIFKSNTGYSFDYRESILKNCGNNPPQIMLPSFEQDYTQDYFKAIFPKAIRLLQESAVLVLIGYSLPEEDALLRFLIKQFAEDKEDARNKIIFYIDMMTEDEQLKRLRSVFPYSENYPNFNIITYSGSFNDWLNEYIH